MLGRLLSIGADPGEIVIGPETARQVRGLLELIPVGPVSVKSRSQPVDVYRIDASR